MDFESYEVSVPGSLMLFGEHAVLHGKQAVVTAINHYIHVDLMPRRDRTIQVVSSVFDEYLTSLDDFVITKPYAYVLTAIKRYLAKIDCGFVLNIRSDFPATIGFGSSAAVTVATLGVLALWLEKHSPELMRLYHQAVNVIRLVQGGIGSGADVAASIFGGVIAYKMKPTTIEKLSANLPLVAVYSGSKISTPIVIAKVKKESLLFPTIFSRLYDAIGCCTEDAIAAIKDNQLSVLGKLMNIHQGLQDALGVNNAVLAGLIFALRAEAKRKKHIYGAKISGAGLGDCVIGLGKIAANTFPKNNGQRKLGIRQIDVAVSAVGLVCL